MTTKKQQIQTTKSSSLSVQSQGIAEADGKKFPYSGIPHLTKEMIDYAEEKLKPSIVQSSPDEGEMERLTVGIDIGSGNESSCLSLAKRCNNGNIKIIANEYVSNELAVFIQEREDILISLQSRLKQAEAENKMLREEHGRMYRYIKSEEGEPSKACGHQFTCNCSQKERESIISSLSNKYPSSK